MKKIVGLGCSWAQGEGGYPEEIWKQYNGRVNLRGVPDEHLRGYEHENSWINVLCRDHLTDYTPVNLGVRGIGNTAAVKQLYLTDEVDWENDSGIIILMCPGLERWDTFNDRPDQHYKFWTAWPQPHDPPKPWWDAYRTEIFCPAMMCMEFLAAVLEAQTFAERYNFKFIFANAYDPYFLPGYLKNHIGEKYTNLIKWDNYYHKHDQYKNFINLLSDLDGFCNHDEHFGTYTELPWPLTYLANCIHPTIEGYKVIANCLYTFIKNNNYDT